MTARQRVAVGSQPLHETLRRCHPRPPRLLLRTDADGTQPEAQKIRREVLPLLHLQPIRRDARAYPRLKRLEITQAWLASCSDGFLNCTSQNGAGSLWFYDDWYTNGGEPLSHNQSRRKCFGLDVILRNDL